MPAAAVTYRLPLLTLSPPEKSLAALVSRNLPSGAPDPPMATLNLRGVASCVICPATMTYPMLPSLVSTVTGVSACSVQVPL